jgi:hypothetical protein
MRGAARFPPGTPVSGTYARAIGGGVLMSLDAGFTGYLPDAALSLYDAIEWSSDVSSCYTSTGLAPPRKEDGP